MISFQADSPYVEYTRGVDFEEGTFFSAFKLDLRLFVWILYFHLFSDENIPVRSVARKSTSGAHKVHKIGKPVRWIPMPVPGRMFVRKFYLKY